jgi:hypothetical protein
MGYYIENFSIISLVLCGLQAAMRTSWLAQSTNNTAMPQAHIKHITAASVGSLFHFAEDRLVAHRVISLRSGI